MYMYVLAYTALCALPHLSSGTSNWFYCLKSGICVQFREMCLFFCTARLHAGSQLPTQISFYYRVGIGHLDLRSCKATVIERNSAALRIMPRSWARLDGQSFVRLSYPPLNHTGTPANNGTPTCSAVHDVFLCTSNPGKLHNVIHRFSKSL